MSSSIVDECEIVEGNSMLSNLVTNFDHQTTLVPQEEEEENVSAPSSVPDRIRYNFIPLWW